MMEEFANEIENSIQRGCFCQKRDQTVYCIRQIIGRFQAKYFPVKMTLNFEETSCDSEYLQTCSSLAMICYLYQSQVIAGHVCNGLAKIVGELIDHNDRLQTILVENIFAHNAFHSFVSIKTFVEFQLAKTLYHNSIDGYIGTYRNLAVLLKNTNSKTLNILSTFEYSVMKLKTPISTSHNTDGCSLMAIKRDILEFDVLFNILDENASLPMLLKQLNECDEIWKEAAIHTLLRTLLLGVDKCMIIKNAFLHQYEPLITLMLKSSCGLILDRCCSLIREILDIKPTTDLTEKNYYDKVKMARDILKHIEINEIVRSEANLKESIGQPYICHDLSRITKSISDENFRNILLLYLTSTSAALSSLNGSLNLVDLDVISTTLSAIETHWKLRIQNCYPLTLFGDQDDNLIEILFNCLEIYKSLKMLNPIDEIAYQFFNPHSLHLSFLKLIGMDYRVLLDFLISEETCFLLYFVKYLKYTLSNFDEYCDFHRNIDEKTTSAATENEKGVSNKVVSLVDYEFSEDESAVEEEINLSAQQISLSCNAQVMPESRLRSVIHTEILDTFLLLSTTIECQMTRNLFPYNAKPLLRLLKKFLKH